jgi:succinate dehydrogenase / fumarate reductase iron-sulfur subunit
MNFKLKVWRQHDRKDGGGFREYAAAGITPEMSFLEMLDSVNAELARKAEDTIAFDHDCREGICGSCGMYINGRAHGPQRGVATCQLYMRSFKDGESIVIEPWRAKSFPVIKDLVVDRSAFDRIMQAGGYISIDTGGVPDGNSILIPKPAAEAAFDAAACIGCGACVAACKNSSAMLFVGAKIAHLAELPQGQVERKERALKMIARMDLEGFGNCSNTYACEAECPKKIPVLNIARMNLEFIRAKLT